jgi:hypothetical protein
VRWQRTPGSVRGGGAQSSSLPRPYHVHLSSNILATPIGEGTMIRRARASDISQVAALYHAVWHETQAPFMPHAENTRRS